MKRLAPLFIALALSPLLAACPGQPSMPEPGQTVQTKVPGRFCSVPGDRAISKRGENLRCQTNDGQAAPRWTVVTD